MTTEDTAPATAGVLTEAHPPPERPRAGSPPRATLAMGRALFGGLAFGLMLLVGIVIAAVRQDYFMVAVAALVFVAPAAAVWLSLSRRKRMLQLWQQGEVASAEVIKSWRKSSGSGESRTSTWWLSYRYEVDGQSYSVKHPVHWKCKLTTIWAIYDPKEPENSLPHY